MLLLSSDQAATLRDRFLPDRPGPLIGLHVVQTGCGACFADHWPDPRATLVDTAGNYSLAGDPAGLSPPDLKGRVAGFVEAPEPFLALLRATFGDPVVWDRVILDLPTATHVPRSSAAVVRRLGPDDAYHVWGLGPESNWIAKTWGGPAGLAASGTAWGAFVDGRLASVACTFFRGERYEDIGVAAEPEFRGLGLSGACAGALCEDIRGRDRTPSWSTSPDNAASLRVAEKLGFALNRRDRLYVVGRSVPVPSHRPTG
ncbi:MAG: GNAT family N-acetyltransferase [Chloroflexota bacterium]|nr:GNAT family N-acetyltransferase [Chloroflexota bacterium]